MCWLWKCVNVYRYLNVHVFCFQICKNRTLLWIFLDLMALKFLLLQFLPHSGKKKERQTTTRFFQMIEGNRRSCHVFCVLHQVLSTAKCFFCCKYYYYPVTTLNLWTADLFVFFAVLGFFIPGFPKLQRFQAHHELILSKMLPKLKKHLVSTSVDERAMEPQSVYWMDSFMLLKTTCAECYCKSKSYNYLERDIFFLLRTDNDEDISMKSICHQLLLHRTRSRWQQGFIPPNGFCSASLTEWVFWTWVFTRSSLFICSPRCFMYLNTASV